MVDHVSSAWNKVSAACWGTVWSEFMERTIFISFIHNGNSWKQLVEETITWKSDCFVSMTSPVPLLEEEHRRADYRLDEKINVLLIHVKYVSWCNKGEW